VIRAITDSNNVVITDPKIICEQFNEWFFTVFREEQSDVMPEIHKLYPNCEVLKIDPIIVEEMLKALNPNKSPGPDNIHPYVLKCCSMSLAMPICLLYQKSLDLGRVPLLWKQANITPAYKSGCKVTLTSYRGISLTSVLCKTMERIVSSHIRVHLNNFNIISKSQHVFPLIYQQ
jgi:hypothetical protein